MDALTTSSPTLNPSSHNQDAAVRPAMPAEALLPMPVQYLDRFEASQRRDWANPASRSVPWLARLVAFGWLTFGATLGGQIRLLSPVLNRLPPFSMHLAWVLFLTGSLLGLLAGALGGFSQREEGILG